MITGDHIATAKAIARRMGFRKTKHHRVDTKRQFLILLVTLKTYWTKKHGFLVFCGL
jgi:magnesium-transporting ATPase (P-type)